jgi:hypothetical protein
MHIDRKWKYIYLKKGSHTYKCNSVLWNSGDFCNILTEMLAGDPHHRVRQSAKPFLQSSKLGLPQPLTRKRVSPPPPAWFWGEGHTRWRERGWESPNSDEGTYIVVLFIFTHFVIHIIDCFNKPDTQVV